MMKVAQLHSQENHSNSAIASTNANIVLSEKGMHILHSRKLLLGLNKTIWNFVRIGFMENRKQYVLSRLEKKGKMKR